MTNEEIEDERIVGELRLVLLNGTMEEKLSLLSVIERYGGIKKRRDWEYWIRINQPT